MPNWRKVITSGSDASLNSLIVINGITGSLYGTARFVDTGSLTSSFVTLNTQQSISGFKSFSALSTYTLQIEDQGNPGNYGQILLAEDIFTFNNINTDNVFTAGTSSLEFGLGTSGKFDIENLSTNRIYQLPDKDGTISLLSDIVGVTGSFVTTGSFNDFTGSYNTGSFTGSFTGSLQGTASNAISASWAPTPNISNLATTGSNTFNGDQIITGSLQITNGITGSILSNGLSGYTTDLSSSYTSRSFVDRNYVNNASNITSGTLDDARLSSNVPLKNTANTFTENQTISKSNPQVELVSATTAKATLLRGETTNTFSLTNDVLEIGGALSNCISFNNSNQYIGSSPTGITGVTQWTVSFWINRSSQGSVNVIYFGDGTNNYQITICCGGTGYLGINYNGSINNWVSTSTVATSGWQHFVVTKDASNILRIYINGSLNNTPVASITNISNISSFRIGNVAGLPNINTNVQNAPTGQRIDQVLFYNTALSLANVQIISAGTTTLPSTGNLLLRYELNEGTDVSTANQGTASNGNGTLVNGVVWEIANGRIPTEAAIQLGTAINIRDGVLNGERGQYRFGDPFGGTIIRGRSIKFQSPLETQFSFIHNGTSTLINPSNTNTSATGSSTLTIIGNTSIGASNIAAPSNGLAVSGRTLIGTSTDNTTDQLQVSGSSLFTGNQRVVGNQTTTGSLLVSGSSQLRGTTTITGSLLINTSGSFVLPLNPMSSPQTGSAYWSGSFLYIWDGIQYRSSSFS